jgi:hypothetical protein
MIVCDEIHVVTPPYPHQDKAMEHAYEMLSYIIVEEDNETTRIKALELALAALIYASKITNCEIVIALESMRTSLLLARRDERERLI